MVENEIPRNIFTANNDTEFLISFYVESAENVNITLDGADVLSFLYYIELEDINNINSNGTKIVFYIPVTGELVITRNTTLEYTTNYSNVTNNINASNLNNDFSRLYRVTQEQALATDVLDAKVIRLNQEQGVALSIEAVARAAGDVANNIYTDNRFDAIASSVAAVEDAEAFLRSYIDSVILNVSFPLDCGLISDPVINNHFDLGGL